MGMLKNDVKGEVWLDFNQKMNYLLERLLDGDEAKLIEYFSDKSVAFNRANRRKTIRNWLNGESKKPNGFEVSRFKIGEIVFNDAPLFTNRSFRLWSFKSFKSRLDNYLTNREIQSHIKYIYFFDTHQEVQQVVAFEVNFPDKNRDELIELSYENIHYRGKIETFNNMTYIRVKNEYDYMQFIFKISANTSKRVKIFGVAQSVDDMTGRPKAFKSLLTSYKMERTEEEQYAHKLNFSNTLFGEMFKSNPRVKEDFFLENFSEKIETLGVDLHHYGIDKVFSKSIYLDTVLKEYHGYIKLLRKARKHTKYFISSKREADLLSMKGVYKGEKIDVSISYFLTMENLFLLDEKNPIITQQMKLVAEGKLSLRYLFVVPDSSLLSDTMIRRIEAMEAVGIEVKMCENSTIGYAKLMLIEGVDFALFKFKDLVGDPTHVTQHLKTIEKLRLEQERLQQTSISLVEFMQKHNPLIGCWYLYAYGSAMGEDDCHEIMLEVYNNHLRGYFSSGILEGSVHKSQHQILLIFEDTVIKVALSNINGNLFRISIIGQDLYINHADLLVFGLLSKEPLSKEEALYLLSEIHMKEEADYRLKVADTFPRRLAEFKANKARR